MLIWLTLLSRIYFSILKNTNYKKHNCLLSKRKKNNKLKINKLKWQGPQSCNREISGPSQIQRKRKIRVLDWWKNKTKSPPRPYGGIYLEFFSKQSQLSPLHLPLLSTSFVVLEVFTTVSLIRYDKFGARGLIVNK